MSILVAVLLGALGLAFVLQPLYGYINIKTLSSKSAPLPEPQLPIEMKSQQTEREQAARSALQEVEFDFQLGNLAEDDYRSLRERYMRRALSALKSRHDHERELDETIEGQVQKLREQDGNATT